MYNRAFPHAGAAEPVMVRSPRVDSAAFPHAKEQRYTPYSTDPMHRRRPSSTQLPSESLQSLASLDAASSFGAGSTDSSGHDSSSPSDRKLPHKEGQALPGVSALLRAAVPSASPDRADVPEANMTPVMNQAYAVDPWKAAAAQTESPSDAASVAYMQPPQSAEACPSYQNQFSQWRPQGPPTRVTRTQSYHDDDPQYAFAQPPAAPSRTPVRARHARHFSDGALVFQSFAASDHQRQSSYQDSDLLAHAQRSYSLDSSDSSGAGEAAVADNPTQTPKNSRYLREMDRRDIISRIDQGEKQAALAKEYQVSRAAICNLNKHRDEVIARKDENPMAKHPKKPRSRTGRSKAKSSSKAPSPSLPSQKEVSAGPGIHELRSRSVALLLTSLRNPETSLAEFQRCSERLMRLLVEEALALVPMRQVPVSSEEAVKSDGVGSKHPPLGVSMEQQQVGECPMLRVFHELEPEQPTGFISPTEWQLPGELQSHNVFLLSEMFQSGEELCRVVQQLLERGVTQDKILVVSLFTLPDAVSFLHAHFSHVRVVTSQMVQLGRDDSRPDFCLSDVDTVSHRFQYVYATQHTV